MEGVVKQKLEPILPNLVTFRSHLYDTPFILYVKLKKVD